MPVPDFAGLPPFPDFNDVTSKVDDLVQRLKQLLLNLDTLNVRSLNAKVIEAGTITAEKMNVTELSAIAANLGHITAGLIESVSIFGSYIATRQNAYPRAEMSNSNDLFGAFLNANESITIQADYLGSPSLNLVHEGNIVGRIDMILGHPEFYGKGGLDLITDNNGSINLQPSGSGSVVLPGSNFSKIKSATGSDLQTTLNGKATTGSNTQPNLAINGGIPIGTVLMVSGGGTVTWTGVPAHSHVQV